MIHLPSSFSLKMDLSFLMLWVGARPVSLARLQIQKGQNIFPRKHFFSSSRFHSLTRLMYRRWCKRNKKTTSEFFSSSKVA